jgi:hypothetical protein
MENILIGQGKEIELNNEFLSLDCSGKLAAQKV